MTLCRKIAILLACFSLAHPALAAEGYWANQAATVAQAIDEAEAIYAKGDIAGAKKAVNEAYFMRFEDTKLEAAIRRHVSAKRAADVEKLFGQMRKAMMANDTSQVKQLAQSIRDAVAVEAKGLDAAKVAPGVFEVNQ